MGFKEDDRDVMGRSATEESFRLTAAYNRSLIEASLDPLVTIDLAGRISDVNAATEQITGRSRKELIGTDFSGYFTDPQKADAGFRQVLDLGLARDYALEIRHKDGHTTPVLYNASVHRDASGRVIGVFASARDITERRARELQLAESEERYRNIFENAIEGIYQTLPGLHLIRVNPSLARMHGYTTPEEMISDFNTPGKKLFVREEDARLYHGLRNQGVVRGFEAELNRKDGSAFWGSMDCRTIRNDEGEVLFYEGIVQDITERKKLEEQLRQAQKLEAVGTLAGGIAHDFNNRLTVITGFGYLIQEGLDSESPLLPYINEILSSAEKAAHLTSSLLAFSRKQRIDLEARSINDIVGSTGGLLRRLLPEDIDVRLSLTQETAVAMADATQVDQVLMNLATNARDAMPEGGVLTIGTSVVRFNEKHPPEGDVPPGAYVVVSVADTGIGMDEATRARIFDPFFTTKEVGRGTGLGLSSVYGIVKQHAGHIAVSSQPGEGAEFRVYLPRIETGEEPHSSGTRVATRGTETLLIAEDDPEVRNLLVQILESSGYTILEAIDGEDAVRIFIQHAETVDLVILDAVMPGKSGREVLETVTKVRPDVQVLLVSGYSGEAMTDKGLTDRVVDFIPKPLQADRLLERVREVLDRKG